MRLSGSDIIDILREREQQFEAEHFRWTQTAMVLEGRHAEVFPQDFLAGGDHRKVGFIRRAWRNFVNLLGKVADVNVSPLSLDPADEQQADLHEKICFAYNDIWNMKRKMNIWASYALSMGACGLGVVPDMTRGWPMLLVEDPRRVFPGPAWSATTRIGRSSSSSIYDVTVPYDLQADAGGPLSNCIVRKDFTGEALLQHFGRGPGADKLNKMIPSTSEALSHAHSTFQYYDDTHLHTTLADGTLLASAEHNIGYCPWQYYSLFNPGDNITSSDLEQQIGLEVAFMRILNQKLELNDGVAYPWLLRKGWTEIDPVERTITAGSADSDAAFLSPPATFQLDRDLGVIRDLLRVMNYETETSFGDVSGGPITGRGVVQLDQIRVATVQSYFDDFSSYLPRVYAAALHMDAQFFGNETKDIAGQGHGEPFVTSYTPSEDIAPGFGRVSVEFGPGLGGFEGHLQMLQSLGADVIPKEDVMRHNPHIRSVSTAKRKVLTEKIEALLLDQALTGQLAVPPDWLISWMKAIREGEEPYEWIIENPPPQPTATPEGVGPVTPDLAAAGLAPPGPPTESLGGEEEMVAPPPLQQLLGI